jgi:hypothetical protein
MRVPEHLPYGCEELTYFVIALVLHLLEELLSIQLLEFD